MSEYESVSRTCALKSLIIFFPFMVNINIQDRNTQRTIFVSPKAYYDDGTDDDDDDDSEYCSETFDQLIPWSILVIQS